MSITAVRENMNLMPSLAKTGSETKELRETKRLLKECTGSQKSLTAGKRNIIRPCC